MIELLLVAFIVCFIACLVVFMVIKSDDGASVSIFLGFAALTALSLAVYGGVKKSLNENACERFAAESSLETKFVVYHDFNTDCLVNVDGTYIPKQNYIVR